MAADRHRPELHGPRPSVGRIVHYVVPDGSEGECRPAIIVRISSVVYLRVFYDPAKDGPPPPTNPVEFDSEKGPGTWHWPERV